MIDSSPPAWDNGDNIGGLDMATREYAIIQAQRAARNFAKPYYAVQVKNGQWKVESAEFVEGPIGRVLYPPARQRLKFFYSGEQVKLA